MTISIRVLDSYGDETASELFTKPLRGVLGGRVVTLGVNGKEDPIFNLWQRVVVGILLVAAFPYTVIALVVLGFAQEKIIKVAQKSVHSSDESSSEQDVVTNDLDAPLSFDELTKGEKDALASIFNGSKLDPAQFDGGIKGMQRDDLESEVGKITSPRYQRFEDQYGTYKALLIPAERDILDGKDANWIDTILLIEKRNDQEHWECWIWNSGNSIARVSAISEFNIPQMIQLLKGDEVMFSNDICRLKV
jgi:hypothetical protein